MTFNPDNFIQEANRAYCVDNQGQRFGQFMMNYLSTVDLEMYRNVPDHADCFYLDSKYGEFVNWIYSQQQ